MRLHLLGIKGLNLANRRFHRIDHGRAKRTVVRQKVNHPHRVGFANVQTNRLASGIGSAALPLVSEGQTERHLIRRRGGSIVDGRRREEKTEGEKGERKSGIFHGLSIVLDRDGRRQWQTGMSVSPLGVVHEWNRGAIADTHDVGTTQCRNLQSLPNGYRTPLQRSGFHLLRPEAAVLVKRHLGQCAGLR